MTYTNIQICNISEKLNKEEIIDKIIKFKEASGYKNINSESENYVKIIFSETSKFITVFDSMFSLDNLSQNKSYIRKLSKKLTLPVFSITNIENEHVVIQQYSFNKRIYDYLSIGNRHTEMKMLEYSDSEYFNNKDIWREYFVGRNNINKLNEVIEYGKTYKDKSYIIEEMFKLYGLSKDRSLYNGMQNISSESVILYFDKVM